jgi:DNA-binding XRE family transcriptional regulator
MKMKSSVREIRCAKGWTLAELGRRIGLTRAGVCRIEKRCSTSLTTALKLSEALEVPPYILFPRLFTEAGCRWGNGSSPAPHQVADTLGEASAPKRNKHA